MRILDLCCGEGYAAIGYHLIFKTDDITGIDTKDMSSSYPFKFIQGDAFALDYEYLEQFDFIHMSPPCQAYSKVTPNEHRSRHKRLIPNALRLGYASGKPFVVENVPGSTIDLRPTTRLVTGTKERFFHANFPVPAVNFTGVDASLLSKKHKHEMLMNWLIPPHFWQLLTVRGRRQGIPPVMTAYIGNCYSESVK